MKKRKEGFYGTAKIISGASNQVTDLELPNRGQSIPTSQDSSFDTPVRIAVVSYRTRLADADGVSAKAAIDGLVHAGIIRDDSPAYVTEVTYRQVKVKNKSEEKTILEIEAAT